MLSVTYTECHLCSVSLMLSVTYAECHLALYAECRYAKGRGALLIAPRLLIENQLADRHLVDSHCIRADLLAD
jgi:hypothetical protein